MIKSLLKLGVLLVIGIVAYNSFFGDEEEKAQAKEITRSVKNLGKSAWGLLKAERQKFKDGKYDEAIGNVKKLYSNLKDKAESIKDSGLLDKIADLEKKRQEIEDKFSDASDEEKKQAKKELDKLLDETEGVMKELEDKK